MRRYHPKHQASLARRIRLNQGLEWGQFTSQWMALNALYNAVEGPSERKRVMNVVEKYLPQPAATRLLGELSAAIQNLAALPPGNVSFSERDKRFRLQSGADLALVRDDTQSATTRMAHLTAVVYQVRCNLLHGTKDPNVQRDRDLVAWSNQVLALLVPALEDAMTR